MSRVDQFESIFRSAAHELFQYSEISTEKVLVVTDLAASEAAVFADRCQRFLSVLESATWHTVDGSDFGNPSELLARIEAERPDLICTHRNLHSAASSLSLGVYLEVLTQTTDIPVLVVPHPTFGPVSALEDTDRVMAMTDHLVGDHDLVNAAAALTRAGGVLFLTHIEDRAVFDRYLDAISKIPSIDTESAEDEIGRQLLKEPRDYIESCRIKLEEHGFRGSVESIVAFGRTLADYRRLVEEEQVDLLVFNTKDDDQLAMHGLVYPLAVELQDLALLML